ncbi:MAG: 4Fe-4S binding protein, partial [Candidatus Bipolaricaulota bacterium]|nr:4Fe-4S binding protein [Candidatus Bipolaricaulota bacterium]
GVKVVLARRECAIQARRRGVAGAIAFDEAKCVLCKRCLKVTGCPALSLVSAGQPLSIREGEPGNGQEKGDSPGASESLERKQPQAASSDKAGDFSRATSIAIDVALCNGCGLCAAVCPTQALGPSREGGQGLGSKPDGAGFDNGGGGRS